MGRLPIARVFLEGVLINRRKIVTSDVENVSSSLPSLSITSGNPIITIWDGRKIRPPVKEQEREQFYYSRLVRVILHRGTEGSCVTLKERKARTTEREKGTVE